ncbi:siroheme synthase [Ferrovum sp. JA12]|uniref:uroporphyrinogen-III C-methyltransferase n=1 Tax=Ferrovum sp. JA12 TaxID=1356299 RepID=UPI0007037C38|nr:uroporphyrinogen-III C-methyltransferase [Ferrovum sp. JA12]KRH78619.1 siroheme synthase [Ferrovum sp. JA12]
MSSKTGKVYLVGAGPGNVDLLTLKALRLLQTCDIVLYDQLVSEDILHLIPRHVTLENVGKQRSFHPVPQVQINQRLIDLALQGNNVLRLKGGDPFIFGRGGEEIDSLKEQGIPFEVVPGVTAANGVAAFAGIPLTHRDYAQSCLFVTAHLKEGSFDLDWSALVRPRQTVVIYMGLHGLDRLATELLQAGMAPDMPVALIEQGTREAQRVVITVLDKLYQESIDHALKSPTLIIIGSVVELQNKLSWFN